MNWNFVFEIALGLVFSNIIMILLSLLFDEFVDYFWGDQ